MRARSRNGEEDMGRRKSVDLEGFQAFFIFLDPVITAMSLSSEFCSHAKV